ncbi:PREDICTED: uncharacterized protein LOC106314835 [Brassica oleracea var. oleracea]|uniref:uncharacterized protein LOC106314835 n=1 Tax=Brassica oleracea var. oleracea TaxID=109376 RepID=UPI0006A6A3C8|nr:PREDICTED: uncharacterized protein LOC106314835 [Brassica oleracea var. oleracea]
MQPTRRISRLSERGTSTPAPSAAGPSGPSRKRIWKQRQEIPPPPSFPPAAYTSSSSTDDEVEAFQPKEPRYQASRAIFQARNQENPEMLRSNITPFSSRFVMSNSAERYEKLAPREFVIQQRLDVNDVKRVVVRSGLIYTLIDSDLFHPNVVKEFIANLGTAEDRGNGVAVFLRGSMVDFSPSLINALYLVPGFEEDHDYLAADIDQVCSFLTNNRVQRWEAMSSKYLTPTNQVLYKLVCSNWIPTTNYMSMNQERLKFLYMIHHHRSFDFGQMVYDQIISFAANINTDRSRRIIFPTLIQQVIDYQRTVLSFEDDEEYTGYPKLVVKDKKAGIGQGAYSSSVDLLADIERTIADLKSIRIRLRRGEYPQYPRQTPQDEEEDEVELDSEESESF